jgi:hypothetical protein
MPSRANDDGKDTAIKVKSYGDTPGYQAPINTNRPSAAPAKPAAVKAAMAADTGATRPMPAAKAPVPRYVEDMPLADAQNKPAGIGGAARGRNRMSIVDKMVNGK